MRLTVFVFVCVCVYRVKTQTGCVVLYLPLLRCSSWLTPLCFSWRSPPWCPNILISGTHSFLFACSHVNLCWLVFCVVVYPVGILFVLPQGGAHPGAAVRSRRCQQRHAPDDHWDSEWEQSLPLWCYAAHLQRYYSAHHYHDYNDLYGNSKAVKINHMTHFPPLALIRSYRIRLH